MTYKLRIRVYRCDKISTGEIYSLNPDYILISPGPKDPKHAGISVQLIKAFHKKLPILGVCLGMQCINEAFGGKTDRSPLPMHGKTSMIRHNNKGLFDMVPSPFKGARYHSLISRKPNGPLITTARSDDGLIMGLSHPEYPLHGVQFHPESFLTEYGSFIIQNFINMGSLEI
jgi:anthranilate synthase component 2